MADVVVAVDEFIRQAGGGGTHVDVVTALDAVGQGNGDAARIAAARGELADMAGAAKLRDHVVAGRIAAQPYLVGPLRAVGDADAVVGDGPVDGQRLATGGVALRAHRLDLQIGIGLGHHVDGMRRLRRVDRGKAVLEHLLGRIGNHEQLVAAAHARRQH